MEASGTTRAVVATAYGGPEVLEVIEVPVGPPAFGEVLIHVRAAGTNPIDYKLYRGTSGQDPDALPMRLGFEAAGVVGAVGEAAEAADGPVAVGDEVIAFPVGGAYADRVVAPGSSVVHKPASLSFDEAAGLMLAGTTAVHALAVVPVQREETLLVHGAASAVGLIAVQLAVAAEVRVIGTASERSHDLLRELGAQPITYGPGLEQRVEALAPGGIDAAIDCIGSDEALDTSLAQVRTPGRIVTIVATPRAFEAGLKVIGQAPGADPGTEVRGAARPRLARLAGEGSLRVIVAASYPLVEAAEAHRALAGAHPPGKILLTP